MSEMLHTLQFDWFQVFYALAVLCGLGLMWSEARKQSVPLAIFLSVFTWVVVTGILFSKVLAWPLSAWGEWFQTGIFPEDHGKTALGGLLGGIFGFWMSTRISGIGSGSWRWLLGWPAVLILFRIGCWGAGCCLGVHTDLPWGVAIEHPESMHGMVGSSPLCTVPVHPVPIYEILFAALLLFGIRKGNRSLQSPRKVFFYSVAAYIGFRFFEAFVRPEYANGDLINPLQWGLLASLPLLLLAARGYRNSQANTREGWERRSPDWVWIGPVILVWIFKSFWSPAEWMGVGVALIALGSVHAKQWFYRAQTHRMSHWLSPLGLIFAALLTGQAAIDQTVQDPYQQTLELGFGGNFGRYQETCGSNRRFWNSGAGVVYRQQFQGKHQLDLGFRSNFGVDWVPSDSTSETIIGVNPYVSYQHRWVGAHLGVHAGRLIFDGENNGFLPSIGLRLGPSDIFFAETNLMNWGYASIPGALQFGIGSGFGLKNGTVFRLGMSSYGFYVHPSIWIKKDLLLEPILAYGERYTYQFGINLRYKIPLISRKSAKNN